MKHDPNHNAYLPGEEWRPYAGYYEVSNLGRVRHVRVLEPRTTKQSKVRGDGYREVTLFVARKRLTRMVHRMVLETFVRPREEGEVCRHLDGDSTNNRLDNLAWGSYQENSDDRKRHGNEVRGNELPQSKLTPEAVLWIRSSNETRSQLARRFGVAYETIASVLRGETWTWVE